MGCCRLWIQKGCDAAYLLFWYHVFTCVSVKLSLAANSILSCTLKYFCRSKLFSNVCNCKSVNAVRAFRCFLLKDELVPPELPSHGRFEPPPTLNESSFVWPITKIKKFISFANLWDKFRSERFKLCAYVLLRLLIPGR